MSTPTSTIGASRQTTAITAAFGTALVVFCQGVATAPFDIADTYHGADSHGHGDVIGADDLFDIQGANLSRVGNILRIHIATSFFTDLGSGTGLGSYPGATFSGNGIGAGDLLLADE